MRILISNDDGIFSCGIQTLTKRLSEDPEYQVYVVAPDRERSATGHALTLHDPLRVEEVTLPGNAKGAWSTTGTPSDCVKFGISALLPEMPDLIVSGINHGPNLANEILYSGTVSAAMEGAFLKIPSIAVSLAGYGYKDFSVAAEFIARLLKVLPAAKLPGKTLLNVNVPAIPAGEIKGVAITELGVRLYNDHFDKRMDPRGRVYYWLSGHAVEESREEGTDTWAILNQMISITPIAFNMTNRETLKTLTDCQSIFGLLEGFVHAISEPQSLKERP